MVDPSSDPSPLDPYSEPTNGFSEHSEPEVLPFDPSLRKVPAPADDFSYSYSYSYSYSEVPFLSEVPVEDFSSLFNYTYVPVEPTRSAPVDPAGSSGQVCPVCGGSGLVSGAPPTAFAYLPSKEGYVVHGYATANYHVCYITNLATGETRVLDVPDDGSA